MNASSATGALGVMSPYGGIFSDVIIIIDYLY